jgi:hypothetical protein
MNALQAMLALAFAFIMQRLVQKRTRQNGIVRVLLKHVDMSSDGIA